MKPDIIIENHGSIVLFRPMTPDARQWLEQNTQTDAQWFGGALAVEPRYTEDLIRALIAVGLIRYQKQDDSGFVSDDAWSQ